MSNKLVEKYVVGIVYSNEHVLLINKIRPEWQKGIFNGLGGMINKGELPIDAMIRECKEECNLDIKYWELYDKVNFDNGVELNYFISKVNDDFIKEFKSMTDEEVVMFNLYKIPENIQDDIKYIITSRIYKGV